MRFIGQADLGILTTSSFLAQELANNGIHGTNLFFSGVLNPHVITVDVTPISGQSVNQVADIITQAFRNMAAVFPYKVSNVRAFIADSSDLVAGLGGSFSNVNLGGTVKVKTIPVVTSINKQGNPIIQQVPVTNDSGGLGGLLASNAQSQKTLTDKANDFAKGLGLSVGTLGVLALFAVVIITQRD